MKSCDGTKPFCTTSKYGRKKRRTRPYCWYVRSWNLFPLAGKTYSRESRGFPQAEKMRRYSGPESTVTCSAAVEKVAIMTAVPVSCAQDRVPTPVGQVSSPLRSGRLPTTRIHPASTLFLCLSRFLLASRTNAKAPFHPRHISSRSTQVHDTRHKTCGLLTTSACKLASAVSTCRQRTWVWLLEVL